MHLLVLLLALLTNPHLQINGKNLRTSRTSDAKCQMHSGSFGTCQNTMACFQHKVMEAIASGGEIQWSNVDKCSYTAPNGQPQNGLCCNDLQFTSLTVVSSYPGSIIATHAQGPQHILHSIQLFPYLPSLLQNNITTASPPNKDKEHVLTPPKEIELKNPIDGPPWIPGVNWPPPLPTHPPHLTIPPLPTHPPDLTIPPLPTHPPGLLPSLIPGWPFPIAPTTEPTVETEKPTAEIEKPTVDTEKPTTETEKPTVETDKPTIETEKPPVQIPDDRCGLKKEIALDFKVVGGKVATKHSWRWIAGLFLGNRLFCGGSLIDSYHVLTAAHCVKGMSPSALTIRLGDHDTSKTSDAPHIAVKVASIQVHPSYSSRKNQNDLALVRLASKVTYTDTIIPVCLAEQGDVTDYANKTVTVAGWGSLAWRQPTTPILYDVNLSVWSNSKCAEGFNKHFHSTGHIVDHMICAGDFGKDSCTGDSGGPLMIEKGNQWIQLGIVSWGIQCGSTHLPGVYTRVSHFRDWIDVNRGV